jgi:hypothetical protein
MRGRRGMAIGGNGIVRDGVGCPGPATSEWTGEAPVSPPIYKLHSKGADECVRPYVSIASAGLLAPLPALAQRMASL